MERVATSVRRRFDPTPLTALVAAGDVLLIGLWILAGEIHHGVRPLEAPLFVLNTTVPYLIGWAVVALLGGMYTRDARSFPKRAVSWTVPAWATAVLIAQALLVLPVFHAGPALTFAVVSIAAGLVVLVPWRVAVAFLDTG